MCHRLGCTFAFPIALLLAATAHAHFAFILPNADQSAVQVIMSETLAPEDGLDANMLRGGKFFLRAAGQSDAPLTPETSDPAVLRFLTPGSGTRLVHGKLDLGVRNHGSAVHLLLYYPKAILGDALDPAMRVGDAAVEMLVKRAEGEPGVQLQLLVNGQPKAEGEINLIFPDGATEKLFTDKNGLSTTIAEPGRYGAWARHWDLTPGQREGKAYEQVRHYGMLVFDMPASAAKPAQPEVAKADAAEPAPAAAPINAERFIDLPIATASFGAVEHDGWLYVYGGHIAPTHVYHTQSASGGFWRLDLASRAPWQTLPGGPALQGMNLAAYDGQIYRVGGMKSINAQDEAANNQSIAQAARFDPRKMEWSDLPPMPEPRSSHDVAVIAGKLYVLGGWQLSGEQKARWPESMFVLDLAAPELKWTTVPQPFKRRALIAAVLDGKLYAIGGFDPESEPSLRVDVYDTRTGTWSAGPTLPSPARNGFAPAACVQDRTIFVSVADGSLYRLSADATAWALESRTTPRIVHRLAAFGGKILVMGGAARGNNLNLVEAVSIRPSATNAIAQVAATPVAAAGQPAPRSTAKASDDPIALGQRVCPVMTDEEVSDASPLVEYKGRKVAVCCDHCVDKFRLDPDAYFDLTRLPQLAGLPTPERKIKQVYCPVMPECVVSASDPSVEYRGQRVYLFNATAVRRWKDNPEKYADPKILPQLEGAASGTR